MPGIAVHTLLGERLLDHWIHHPTEAPFPAGVSCLRNAFLAGCMGPDMGYFPGADSFISDLAHYLRTSDLIRQLLHRASTPRERAYAWGWFCHALADVLIHPLINKAAAAVAGADVPALSYADNPPLHVAVEVGLDGYTLWRHRTRSKGFRSAFTHQQINFLSFCFQNVYGPVLSTRTLYRGHLLSARGSGLAHRLSQAAAGMYGLPDPGGWFNVLVYRPAQLLTRTLARGTAVHSLVHPLLASPVLAQEMDAMVGLYVECFREHFHQGLRDWPDYNLDTGRVEKPEDYVLAVQTARRLELVTSEK